MSNEETFRNACQGKATVILPHADASAATLQIVRERITGPRPASGRHAARTSESAEQGDKEQQPRTGGDPLNRHVR